MILCNAGLRDLQLISLLINHPTEVHVEFLVGPIKCICISLHTVVIPETFVSGLQDVCLNEF